MRNGCGQRGFVLSGTALLLTLPALILVASCLAAIEIGGEAVAVQISADKVSNAGKNIERAVTEIWEENLLFDGEPNANATFVELEESYREATGLLVDITPRWMLWCQSSGGSYYAGTKSCKIVRVGRDSWRYCFEQGSFWWWDVEDYDEPVLLVTRLEGGLQITLENYGWWWWPADIYYDNILLWNDVRAWDVEETKTVENTVQLVVHISVSDPAGNARYESTVELG